ncbi:1-acyl-sn-glycerol-3-phosphate acyltransferase BAT2, chloroplastic-like [Phragmites australis]|uniref:1-acyl-sn-glycerol-3-phosphate acyltransferase BAT2, chloroplastic-like n=1 Tax=Phragmites australis TaxID=29695 RepID=UPI002D766351|nr:1-acyl-sn-glycerol-3-phosphate acyltransferase BAT2, chloroplastic-like [Phragmites australis]
MGTLLRPGPPAAPAAASPLPVSFSSAHAAAGGGGARIQPRRVSAVVFRSPSRQVLATRCRRRDTVVRSDVLAGGAAAAAGDSTQALSDLQVAPRVRGVCFYMVTAVAAIFLFIAMVVVHPLVLLFDRYRRRAQHYIAKVWATLTISMFYKLEIKGMENLPPNSSPAVYVANHQSFLDIYTLLTLGRCFKFISKTSIFMFPIIGWAMYLLGVIPLRRTDSRSQLDCLKRCVDLVNKGASVFFFPEGTRSKDGKLGVFKRGAFSVATKTGAPVIPITLIGTGKLMPSGMESTLNSGSVKVIIHRPIKGNDAETLCSEARNVIADTLLLHGYGVH